MKNIYTPGDIERIVDATLGRLDDIAELDTQRQALWFERRRVFVEQVGRQVAIEVDEFRGSSKAEIIIFAGDGICGAYALSAASQLYMAGAPVKAVLFNIGGEMLIPDTVKARDTFVKVAGAEALQEFINPAESFEMPVMNHHTIVIDGIFGSEYKKPLRGGYQTVARLINEARPRVVSIDLPSGMTTDLGVGMINRNIIHADLTLTLVGPTLSFFMTENAELIGRWKTTLSLE